VERVVGSGFSVGHVDVTIIGARPRLADRLDEIGARIGELLRVEARRVNVKASTGNLAGMEGAGRGISARAVATLERPQ
jgi:2-C-methyl-D-erythritol 2,4-cyclodiphosphate synthase